MSDTIRSALLFLINTLFNLYLFILVLRVILVFVRSDYFNPITQFVVRLTDVIIQPLRKTLPNVKNIETASLAAIVVLELIKFFLIACISYGIPNFIGIIVLAGADILSLIIQAFTYGIILQAILSFIQPMSPLRGVLARFNSPIMQPIQRLVPPVGGIDLTPIPALILLQLMNIVLTVPLNAMGSAIAFG